MTRLLVIAAIALAGTIGVMTLASPAGLSEDDWMRVVWMTIILASTGAWVLSSQKTLPSALRNLMIWVLIGLGLASLWIASQEKDGWIGRIAAALKPGSVTTITDSEGRSEVLIYKASDGHYHADVTINGTVVPMLVDTGATGIALTWEDAEALGLKPGSLSFDKPIMTANGRAMAASVRLGEVAIGPIRRGNLDAGVAQQGMLHRSLLGMNFLETLSAVTMTGQQLRLSD